MSGSEDGYVRQYSKDSKTMSGAVWDANGVGIRCLSVDFTGKRVAITSE